MICTIYWDSKNNIESSMQLNGETKRSNSNSNPILTRLMSLTNDPIAPPLMTHTSQIYVLHHWKPKPCRFVTCIVLSIYNGSCNIQNPPLSFNFLLVLKPLETSVEGDLLFVLASGIHGSQNSIVSKWEWPLCFSFGFWIRGDPIMFLDDLFS